MRHFLAYASATPRRLHTGTHLKGHAADMLILIDDAIYLGRYAKYIERQRKTRFSRRKLELSLRRAIQGAADGWRYLFLDCHRFAPHLHFISLTISDDHRSRSSHDFSSPSSLVLKVITIIHAGSLSMWV